MPTQYGRIVRSLLIVGLMAFFGVYTFAQDDMCDRNAKTFKLKIKIKKNTPTKIVKGNNDQDADELHVCRGDTIEWKMQNKTFFISFPKSTPLNSNSRISRNGKITAEVSDTAVREVPHKYDIGIDEGGTLDPTVVVD